MSMVATGRIILADVGHATRNTPHDEVRLFLKVCKPRAKKWNERGTKKRRFCAVRVTRLANSTRWFCARFERGKNCVLNLSRSSDNALKMELANRRGSAARENFAGASAHVHTTVCLGRRACASARKRA